MSRARSTVQPPGMLQVLRAAQSARFAGDTERYEALTDVFRWWKRTRGDLTDYAPADDLWRLIEGRTQ